MSNWFARTFRLNFHGQITCLISLGIILLAVIASLTAGWVINQKMTELLKQQGRQITTNLAHQAILPLLSGVGGSAASDIDSIMTFNFVRSVSIYEFNGEVLISSDKENTAPLVINDNRLEQPFKPVLYEEGDTYWTFKASVYDIDVFDRESDSIDSLFVPNPTLIGYVSVTLDRTSLYAIQRALIIDNLWISIIVALVLIFASYIIVKRMITPLYELAAQMKRAKHGEDHIRAELSGSDEIQHMSRAFNTMMAALEQRREYAEHQHASLLKEIKERKAVEGALRSSEMHFRAVFENVVDGILIANDKGVIESANPAATRLIDKSPRELMNKPLNEVLGLSNYRMDEEVNIGYLNKKNEHLELSLKFSEMVLKGEQKQIVIVHDITESQRQKQRIESLLSQLKAIVSSIPGVIIEVTQDGRLTWWNRKTEEITGLTGDQIRQRTIHDFLPLEDVPRVVAAVKQGFDEGKVELHANVYTAEGVVPYQFSGLRVTSPNIGNSGSRVTLLAIGMDDSLSIRTQQALQQARDAALESARIKSEFLANMSHEIRTPMNGMIGMLQLLAESRLDEEQKGYIDIAIRSSDQLLAIINDILDFSKIEAGKMLLQHEDFSPRTLIEESLELFAKRIQEKGLKLYSRIALDIPELVEGDVKRLTQVLSNLIGNAYKFTSTGYILVDAKSVTLNNGPAMKVSVIDTGIGIADELQEKVFESFAQIDGSSTRKYSGTGLGLAIIKQLVELMGGFVELKSKLNKGSEFSFTVPLKVQECQIPTSLSLNIKEVGYIGRDPIQASIVELYLSSVGGTLNKQFLEQGAGGNPFVDSGIYIVELECMDELKALFEGRDLENIHVILISDYQNHYNKQRFPLPVWVTRLQAPIRTNSLIPALFEKPDNSKIAVLKPKTVVQAPQQKTARILVVEDNDTNKQVIVTMLEKLGYKPEVATNGEEAIAKVQEENYDLIFMDCQMPVMDGYQATGVIRSSEGKSRHVAIVAMTGNAMEGDRERCLAAGMDDYIPKPVRLAKLKETIQHWLPEKNIRAT